MAYLPIFSSTAPFPSPQVLEVRLQIASLDCPVIMEADRDDICDVITLPRLKVLVLLQLGLLQSLRTPILERLCMGVSNLRFASFSPICSSF